MAAINTATMVADININGSAAIGNLTVFNNVLYFKANDGTGTKLWRYDGSTVSVAANVGTPEEFTVFKDMLYFTAVPVNSGRTLWRYDGTTTSQVTNFGVASLAVFNDALYFSGDDGDGAEQRQRPACVMCGAGRKVRQRELACGARGGVARAEDRAEGGVVIPGQRDRRRNAADDEVQRRAGFSPPIPPG